MTGAAMSGTEARRARTASKEVRRRQLVEATIESIATHGMSGTTMATVTGLANLSMGIVSLHFRSKDNLFAETLGHLAEEHRAQWIECMGNALTPEAKLTALVDAHFHPNVCTPEKVSVWFAFFGESRYRDTYLERVAHIDTERTEITERLCRELVETGGYTDVDPHEIAQTLETLSDGLWLSFMLYPRWLSREDARARVMGYLARTFPCHFAAGPCRSRPHQGSPAPGGVEP